VDCDVGDPSAWEHITYFVEPPWALHNLTSGFTSLHTLRICGFPSHPEDFFKLLVAISERITTVSIFNASFNSYHDLWTTLRLFPNLQNVHASNLGYHSGVEGILAILPGQCHSPPIASFSLHTHCLGFALEQLAEPPYPLTHLKSLGIHHTDQHQPHLNSIAAKYRNAITTLKFSAYSTSGSGMCSSPPLSTTWGR
jgi:hypothetical protein